MRMFAFISRKTQPSFAGLQKNAYVVTKRRLVGSVGLATAIV